MVSKQPDRSQNAVGFSGFAEKVKLEITNEINAHKKGAGRDSSIEKLEEIYREVEQMVKIRSDKEFSPRYPSVNDVLQCLDLDGANCPKTDGFTVQNEEEAILCSPFILQIYLIRFIFLKIKFYFISASNDIPVSAKFQAAGKSPTIS